MEQKLKEIKKKALEDIAQVKSKKDLEAFRIKYLGRKGALASLMKKIKDLPEKERPLVGKVANEVKKILQIAWSEKKGQIQDTGGQIFVDITQPGKRISPGHLHLITQAIREIERIFLGLGFVRRRYPEIETDYYAFEALNMPQDHPARDEWETFFIQIPRLPSASPQANGGQANSPPAIGFASGEWRAGKFPACHRLRLRRMAGRQIPNRGNLVLTPHTSSGQVREMENHPLPIRMMNISKCYRRQIDVSHTPMFHQFEGLVVDKGITFSHLKGVLEYFCQEFFGPERKIRLRPFHFRFTEPSFEVDVTCGLCGGKGCRYCKQGWSELGGAGMVHPRVLEAGGLDPAKVTGFAFGWGVERCYLMKEGLLIPDLRMLYQNDLRFLEQF